MEGGSEIPAIEGAGDLAVDKEEKPMLTIQHDLVTSKGFWTNCRSLTFSQGSLAYGSGSNKEGTGVAKHAINGQVD